ncbi:MAG TPA: type II toxin-antitoxin system prevent-host-death family antitoxin [Gammaproteobacteria bacterium]|nr:type II toxin-antitoxin system prevent-host-death family antitoxin [Gammaproteobacteria bacterium]
MKQIGIKEARQNLRGLIARVELGEHILITRQGKAVAQLGPARKLHRKLPELTEFREGIGRVGTPAAALLRAERAMK